MSDDDAFGTALFDWVHGGRIAEVLERDDGYFEEGAGPEIYLSGVEEWPAGERASLKHLRGRVVDLGCGAGRVALVLQEQGVEVVGIDASEMAVRAARAAGVKRVRCQKLEGLVDEIDRFESILLYGNNFGIFSSPDRARRILIRWARSARPGTRIFAESTSPYFGGAPIIDRTYYRRNQARGYPPGRVRFRIRYRELVGPWVTWLFTSQGQLRSIARGSGWEVETVLADGLTEPYVAVLERR